MIATKDEIPTYHSGNPEVNVKVYDSLEDGFKKFQKYEPDANRHFTLDWIEQHVSEETLDSLFWSACEWGWEMLQSEAEEIFGKYVKVYSEGRSGGWATVHGLSDIDEWDAIALGKWRKFAKLARAEADDVMYQVIMGVYINEFDAWVRA